MDSRLTKNTLAYNIAFQIASEISQITGNQFNEKHESMLENRLKKRATELKLKSLSSYYDYYLANKQEELKFLISLLTTHHTFFFREFIHFEILEEKVLPLLIEKARLRQDKKIKIWSAACSKGHEVYSLALFFDFHLKKNAPDLSFEILGSDIDHESIEIALNGVYSRKESKDIPLAYIGTHVAKGTGEISDFFKFKDSIRSKLQWKELNLLNLNLDKNQKFDVIFCRNVFIYFNSKQIETSTTELLKYLNPHGALFVGLSESLASLKMPIKTIGPSVYLNTVDEKQTKSNVIEIKQPSRVEAPSPVIEPSMQLRVVCVDDSPSIITLLKKILSKDEGFEVVGTAKNGIEAHKLIKDLKPDIVTLDIHMPEMTGVEYLQSYFNDQHPPVLMVSSVSREDEQLGFKALELGASDFIEKPALSNINQLGEELKKKLRVAFKNKTKLSDALKFENSFHRNLKLSKFTDSLVCIIYGSGDELKLTQIYNEFLGSKPATLAIFDDSLTSFQKTKSAVTDFNNIANDLTRLKINSNQKYFSILDEKLVKDLEVFTRNLKVVMMVLGKPKKALLDSFTHFHNMKLIIEDHNLNSEISSEIAMKLNKHKVEITPITSFSYIATQFLGQFENE